MKFFMSIAFAAGFVIRDLMEEKSQIRDAAKDLWTSALDFLKPVNDKNAGKESSSKEEESGPE